MDDVKKIVITIAGIVTFVLVYVAAQQIFVKPDSFDKTMMAVASDLNKTCPIMVNQYTRLDNAVALPANVFQYNYTLVLWEKAEINIDTLRKYNEPELVNSLRTNPGLKAFRENKVTMKYSYRDKNGEFVLLVSVSPDMYEN